MTPTGITVKEINSTSYEKNNEQRVTRIEVDSEKLKMVKNSKYNHPIDDMFYEMFKSFGEIYNNKVV